MKIVCALMFFLIHSTLLSSAKEKIREPTSDHNKKSLVLQWEVSHFRNTDQISLIFRKDNVELITNISLSKPNESARLGHFNTPMNSQLKILKEEIQQYYIRLKNTTPITSLIQNTRLQTPINPHAPILRINNQEINSEHIYFKYLENILHQQTKGNSWRCIECATYKLLHKEKPKTEIKIQRVMKKERKTITQSFTTEELKCLLKEQNEWECIDPEFGIFVLKQKNKKEHK